MWSGDGRQWPIIFFFTRARGHDCCTSDRPQQETKFRSMQYRNFLFLFIVDGQNVLTLSITESLLVLLQALRLRFLFWFNPFCHRFLPFTPFRTLLQVFTSFQNHTGYIWGPFVTGCQCHSEPVMCTLVHCQELRTSCNGIHPFPAAMQIPVWNPQKLAEVSWPTSAHCKWKFLWLTHKWKLCLIPLMILAVDKLNAQVLVL
jgi:hypothetical protein